MQESFEKFRLLFYVTLLTLLFGISLAWALIFATSLEIHNNFGNLMKAFGYLGLGFFFYISKFPEKRYSNYYI